MWLKIVLAGESLGESSPLEGSLREGAAALRIQQRLLMQAQAQVRCRAVSVAHIQLWVPDVEAAAAGEQLGVRCDCADKVLSLQFPH